MSHDVSSDERVELRRFGAALKRARIAARLSRVALGKLAQLSEASIKFFETARARPSLASLTKLMAVTELQLTLADVPDSLRDAVADMVTHPSFEPVKVVVTVCPRCRTTFHPCSTGVSCSSPRCAEQHDARNQQAHADCTEDAGCDR